MANLDTHHLGSDVNSVRQAVRRSAQAQEARMLLAAASLSAFGLVAVAATLLINLL